MTLNDLIRESREQGKNFDNIKIVGEGWSGNSRMGFMCNPTTGTGCPSTGGSSAPGGACCFGTECEITTQAFCEANGGDYQGDGTPCSPNPCGGGTPCCPEGDRQITELSSVTFTLDVQVDCSTDPLYNCLGLGPVTVGSRTWTRVDHAFGFPASPLDGEFEAWCQDGTFNFVPATNVPSIDGHCESGFGLVSAMVIKSLLTPSCSGDCGDVASPNYTKAYGFAGISATDTESGCVYSISVGNQASNGCLTCENFILPSIVCGSFGGGTFSSLAALIGTHVYVVTCTTGSDCHITYTYTVTVA